MADMNTVCLVGRLTKDPEARTTTTGKHVCSFSIGVSRPKKKDEEEAGADFPNIVAWNHDAEYIAQYGHKGDAVAITGRIQTRSYDDKEGRKIYVTEVLANSVQLITKKQTSASGEFLRTGNSWSQEEISQQIQETETINDEGDVLPF